MILLYYIIINLKDGEKTRFIMLKGLNTLTNRDNMSRTANGEFLLS